MTATSINRSIDLQNQVQDQVQGDSLENNIDSIPKAKANSSGSIGPNLIHVNDGVTTTVH